MKNLNKSSKTILAVVAAVVVIGVLVLVVFQPPVNELFGTGVTVTAVKITPADPTINYPGLQVNLTANYSTCTWSVSDATLVIRSSSGSSALIEGGKAGKATVTASCLARVGNGQTKVMGTTSVKVGSYPFGQ
jgi:hypothetical protein